MKNAIGTLPVQVEYCGRSWRRREGIRLDRCISPPSGLRHISTAADRQVSGAARSSRIPANGVRLKELDVLGSIGETGRRATAYKRANLDAPFTLMRAVKLHPRAAGTYVFRKAAQAVADLQGVVSLPRALSARVMANAAR